MTIREINCQTGEVVEREFTAEELASLPTPPTLTPLQKITEIEQGNPITHRMLRDMLLALGQVAGAVTGKDPLENKAVRDVIELNAKIDPLREEAKEQGLIP